MLYAGPNTGIYFQISLGVLVGIALGATAMSVPVSEVGKHFPNQNNCYGCCNRCSLGKLFLAPLFTQFLWAIQVGNKR